MIVIPILWRFINGFISAFISRLISMRIINILFT